MTRLGVSDAMIIIAMAIGAMLAAMGGARVAAMIMRWPANPATIGRIRMTP
jgi:hypothetical protein